MKQQFLEAGKIVNTHGIRGEVKIVPWCDSPEFLCDFWTIYIDGNPVKLLRTSIHKGNILATIEGVSDVNAAMRLKDKVVFIDRDEAQAKLPEGRHFLADLMGLPVLDDETGEELGVLADVLTPSHQQVYVVRGKGKEYMIPAVDAFIKETNVDEGYIKVHLIEGMG